MEAYLPNTTEAQRRDPWISPFYAKMNEMKVRILLQLTYIFECLELTCLQLPPALFTCGTSDPLLDDSVMMSTKWAMSGAESILKVSDPVFMWAEKY